MNEERHDCGGKQKTKRKGRHDRIQRHTGEKTTGQVSVFNLAVVVVVVEAVVAVVLAAAINIGWGAFRTLSRTHCVSLPMSRSLNTATTSSALDSPVLIKKNKSIFTQSPEKDNINELSSTY